MLTELRSILQRGVEVPGALPASIREFLALFDSIPEGGMAAGVEVERTLEHLAYELRYYAPQEPSDETLLNDKQAIAEIRHVLAKLS